MPFKSSFSFSAWVRSIAGPLERPKLMLLLLVTLFGILFWVTAPISVQSGDTGELVTSAYFLRVPHPPGYPLWNLLYHLPVRYLSGESPFHTAALTTIGITLIWMGLLHRMFLGTTGFVIISVAASSMLVWRYAILPDVFSLHLFFILLVLASFRRPTLLKNPVFLFALSLSVAHHHTIVLVFPLFAYAFYQVRSWRLFGMSLLFGAVSLSLYGLLLLFHPKDYGSWASLEDFGDVLNHFLRTDYGTFRLHGRGEQGSSWVQFFADHLLPEIWSLILCVCYLVVAHWKTVRLELPRLSALAFTIVLYFVVFSTLGKMQLDMEREAVFERFLLQPLLLLVFLLLFLAHLPGVKLPKFLILALLVNVGLNVSHNFTSLNYRRNTAIEDYLMNGLRILPPKAVVHMVGDTSGFGTYYLKDVKRVRPDVIHMQNSYGFPWAIKKFREKYPGLVTFRSDIGQFVVDPKYRFFTNHLQYNVPVGYGASYYGLLFEVAPLDLKKYVRFDCKRIQSLTFRHRPSLSDFGSYEPSRAFDNIYGTCDFEQALEQIRGRQFEAAATSLKAAIQHSPFHVKALERLCFVYRERKLPAARACDEELDRLIGAMHQQYVTEKY